MSLSLTKFFHRNIDLKLKCNFYEQYKLNGILKWTFGCGQKCRLRCFIHMLAKTFQDVTLKLLLFPATNREQSLFFNLHFWPLTLIVLFSGRAWFRWRGSLCLENSGIIGTHMIKIRSKNSEDLLYLAQTKNNKKSFPCFYSLHNDLKADLSLPRPQNAVLSLSSNPALPKSYSWECF